MTRKNQAGLTATLLWAALASLPVASITLLAGVFATVQAQDAVFPLPTAAPKGKTVRLDGSESMSLVGQALKQQYEKDLSGKVETATSGVEGALAGLAAGKVDTALIGRELTEEEKAQGLFQSLLEREKIAIVVSTDNPFAGDIGYAQFAKIFRGEIKDWSELGGPAGAIRLVDRPGASDTRQSFSTYPAFKSAPFEAGATAASLTEDNTALMVKQLGKDGVGYALYSQVKDLPGVKVIPMHKVLPSDPAYPYSQPRVLAYKGEPNDATKAFLGFASNEPGKAVLDSVEAAEAEAIAAGNSPNSPDLLQKLAAGTTKAVDSAVGGVKDAAGAAGDAAKGTVDAAGNVLGNTANAVAGVDRSISPLWGILPLAGLAAGGGLLWWLAAGKDDEREEEMRDRDRIAVGANAGRDSRTGTFQADNLQNDGYRPDPARPGIGDSIDGIQSRARDLGTGAVDGVRGVGSNIKGVGTDIGTGLGNAAGNAAQGTGNVVRGVGAAAAGLGGAALGGAAAAGKGVGNLFNRTQDAAGNAVDGAGNVAGATTGLFGRVKDALSDAAHVTGDAARNVKDGAVDLAGGVKDGASDLVSGARDGASNLAEGVQGATTEASDAARDRWDETTNG
ncbi:MAG: hypothetical protein HC771_04035 [Synechococcales cyanobacterium CRU_2_2]|nr:hypothetical protein [Synechococcales cyanobacterium CRU_2_2]